MASSSEVRDSPSTSPPAIKRGRFYYETITLEVEGTLHRVHRYGFETWSSFFRDLFSLPQGNVEREGDTDENPIKLVGCTNFELESLLEVMYPRGLAVPPAISKEQWIGVLRLSRLWDMPEIAAIAIDKLSACSLPPVEKVKLGKEHGVPTWLKEGYVTLIKDPSQTSLEDMSGLGWETAFRILWARDRTSKPGGLWVPEGGMFCSYCCNNMGCTRTISLKDLTGTCPYCGSSHSRPAIDALILSRQPGSGPMSDVMIAEKVSDVFGEELKDAERRNSPSQ